jgi:hypothetical protein
MELLNLAVSAVISGVSASIGGLLVASYLKKALKNDLKAEIIGFLESEDAPKLLNAVGRALGSGLTGSLGSMNPLKGNINIFGMKIPKVIAFGAAQKMGLLPQNLGIAGDAPTPALPSVIPNPFEENR